MRRQMETLWVVVILAAIAYTAWSGFENTRRIDHLVSAQLQNRVENVAVWCGAVNQDREYARHRALVDHRPPYRLRDLDCRALERSTARSSR